MIKTSAHSFFSYISNMYQDNDQHFTIKCFLLKGSVLNLKKKNKITKSKTALFFNLAIIELWPSFSLFPRLIKTDVCIFCSLENSEIKTAIECNRFTSDIFNFCADIRPQRGKPFYLFYIIFV